MNPPFLICEYRRGELLEIRRAHVRARGVRCVEQRDDAGELAVILFSCERLEERAEEGRHRVALAREAVRIRIVSEHPRGFFAVEHLYALRQVYREGFAGGYHDGIAVLVVHLRSVNDQRDRIAGGALRHYPLLVVAVVHIDGHVVFDAAELVYQIDEQAYLAAYVIIYR